MSAQHLMAHRFLFWQQRGFITTQLAESLARLETHFKDYSDDPDRASELMDIAMAVRDGTGRKVSLKVTWRLVPAVHYILDITPSMETDDDGRCASTAFGSALRLRRRASATRSM
jgi:hypothetical protein